MKQIRQIKINEKNGYIKTEKNTKGGCPSCHI
jgi:hypothetical protein